MKYLFLTTGMAIALMIALWLLSWLWRLWKYRGAVEMANTVPLEECRRILGKDCGITNSELELLRDQLGGLARVVVDACARQRRGNGPQTAPAPPPQAIDSAARLREPQKPAGLPEALAMLPEEERYEVEERAAIHEFDGGLDRDAAERAAFTFYCRPKRGENSDERTHT